MYTSGTTGNPKGVIIDHFGMAAKCMIGPFHSISYSKDDVYYSYLPLAHCAERSVLHIKIVDGSQIGFNTTILNIVSDLMCLKPTTMVAVPRILNRLKDKIQSDFNNKTGDEKELIDKALHAKMSVGACKHEEYDQLIFNKTAAFLGGKMKTMVVGTAPTSQETFNFMKAVFC